MPDSGTSDNDEQLDDLLSARMHRRTRVMIQLAAYAGLLVHEVAKIRGEDVDPTARTLRHRQEKRDRQAADPRPGAADIIGNAMDRADIPGGTAHRLRHGYGTKLVSSGTDLRTTQTLMRHAQLSTTAIYVQVPNSEDARAVDHL